MRRTGQLAIYTIDLTKIEGQGEFPCPCCGSIISPDDETEEAYTITDVETREDGSILTLSLQCNKCRSTILLKGFEVLDRIDAENQKDVE
ncbi:MAG: hypothetical protein RMJ07_03640 [Nitrososphaerota archaeon]|nr:hypothetical protein [Candidatus Bathyarchaeota archaeon]MDW8048755.1 hypothetical protein [Nitrososphaerota archaeon]